MELRQRAEQLVCRKDPPAMPPPSRATATLFHHERSFANCRWMRGAMCYLAVLTFGLSLFDIDTYTGDVVVHVLMLLLSLGGEAAIISVYRSRAALHGMRNHAGPVSHFSVLHSPLLGKMFVEMIVWLLQCPPGLSRAHAWSRALDGLVILRLYVFPLYLSNLTHASLFPRAVSSLSPVRLPNRFFLRRLFLPAHVPAALLIFLSVLFLLSLSYARAESVPFADALYFCCNTAALVGFGDVAPATGGGRAAAVAAWAFGVAALLWAAAALRAALRLGDAERHLRALFRSNELCARLPPQAARVIQRAWRVRAARRRNANAVARQAAAFMLTQQAMVFRDMRRELRAAESVFLQSIYTDEDRAFAATPPGTTPLGSPRTRRPFAASQKMRTKAEMRGGAWTPRSPASCSATGERGVNADELNNRLMALERKLERLALTAERLEGHREMHISV